MRYINKLLLPSLMVILAVTGCDKNKPYDTKVPEAEVHFVGSKFQSYPVEVDPAPTYTITIGSTDVTDADRTVAFTVSSPTGAVAGTQYTLSNTTGTVTIPKGQATTSFTVQGNLASYTGGRKDTLVFTLKDPNGFALAGFQDTVKLAMRGPCFDGDVTNLGVMAGSYAHSTDPDDAQYNVTVSGITSTGATTGTAMIGNLWDWFTPVTINFDWTDPNNTKVSIPLQDAGQVYAPGQPFLIRTSPGQVNKFSVCNQKITLIVDLIVNNYPTVGSAAYYEQNYPMTIQR